MKKQNNRILGTVGHWQNNRTKQTTPRNTTNREPWYIEQRAWQNTKQKNKEFYGKVTLGYKVLSFKNFIRKWRVKYFHMSKNVVKLKLFPYKKDASCLYFFILFSLFNLFTWDTYAVASTYDHINVCKRKIFGGTFQETRPRFHIMHMHSSLCPGWLHYSSIATSRFSAKVDCFFALLCTVYIS